MVPISLSPLSLFFPKRSTSGFLASAVEQAKPAALSSKSSSKQLHTQNAIKHPVVAPLPRTAPRQTLPRSTLVSPGSFASMPPAVKTPWMMYITLIFFGFGLMVVAMAILASTGLPFTLSALQDMGVKNPYFALESPPGHWFFSVGGLVLFSMLMNFIFMIVTLSEDEPWAFILNAFIFVAVLVFYSVMPQFIDASCISSTTGCPGSSIYFVWRT